MNEVNDVQRRIREFLAGSPHAVVGASRDRSKYGNKVLRCYLQHDRDVLAVNPNAGSVEGVTSYDRLDSLPVAVHGISVITPPEVTTAVVEDAIELGIRHVWLQPGAESRGAIESGRAAGINLIAGGPCLLVALGFRESEG